MIEFNKKTHPSSELRVARLLAELVYRVGGDPRFYVNHIKVEKDGSAVSCEGNRLHHVTAFTSLKKALSPGYYKVAKLTKTLVWLVFVEDDGQDYPNYSDILKSKGDKVRELFLMMDIGGVHGSFAEFIRAVPSKRFFNFYFFEALCRIFDETVSVEIHIDHNAEEGDHVNKAAVFRLEDKDITLTALIMPMR